MLDDLTSLPYLLTGSSYESALTRGSCEYDVCEEIGAIFGDFYLVEAMLRNKQLNASD